MSNLHMSPAPGTRLVRHAGDFLRFELRGVPAGWTARLRTNLGRAARLRDEIVRAHFGRIPLAGASWRDLPLQDDGHGVFHLTLPLAEVGYFKAKAYALDPRGFQHWPHGPDAGLSIHPAWTRTGNTIYCAFPRMFGPNKKQRVTVAASPDPRITSLDAEHYAVIPPGGTLRDVIRELPHILGTLGCRILHLLPVSPVPTTFARFGRFGSPYALQHLTAIDPALVEFDKRSTGVDQFCELARAVHARGARLMLDLVINHTGWGSSLWEEHPEWFVRKPDGEFESPGAWNVVWEDLVELDQRHKDLWEHLAEAFLTWCRRGVDAFRCDAGYKIPTHVWQYITARVHQEFPETVFLLEGLGGPWEATEALLGEGGMQWAYSELFQNFGGASIGGYLEHNFKACQHAGTLIHYSETHDNSRLAAHAFAEAVSESAIRSPHSAINTLWSRHRNRLCALTSVSGGFGFTCGVEWLATEQINVHSSRGLAWGGEPNLLAELGHLNQLLADHPCFFDGARLARLSPDGSPVYALRRDSAEGSDSVLVLVNTDAEHEQSFHLETHLWSEFCATGHDLLEPRAEHRRIITGHAGTATVEITLRPGAVHCLAPRLKPAGLSGEAYRHARARADWAVQAAHLANPAAQGLPTGEACTLLAREHWQFGTLSPDHLAAGSAWTKLAAEVDRDPATVLARASGVTDGYQPVIQWHLADRDRVVPVPPDHWLLLRDTVPFRACLTGARGELSENVVSIPAAGGHIACFPPRFPGTTADASLVLERYADAATAVHGTVRFLASDPAEIPHSALRTPHSVVLLTNGRGAMARLRVNLGDIQSKYDCLLGANLHDRVPVDRHVFAKRVRAWLNADGFSSPLNFDNLVDFEPGPPAHWRFVANAGDGRCVELHLTADLLPDRNTVVLSFHRPNGGQRQHELRFGCPLPDSAKVSLVLRVDLEDRNFHWETKHGGGADYHFSANCRQTVVGPHAGGPAQPAFNGFEFTPAPDRRLRVWTDRGEYHHGGEWSLNVPHPVEATRGQEGAGDAYSPGWFEVPLTRGETSLLVVSADAELPAAADLETFVAQRGQLRATAELRAAAVGQASGLSSWGVPPQNENAGGTPATDRPEAGPAPPVVFTPYDRSRPVSVARRHLPHWRQDGATYFVTFRLADSLPLALLRRWQAEHDEQRRQLPEPPDPAQLAALESRFADKLDDLLNAGHGDCWLQRTELAEIVEQSLRHFDGERYALGEFVIMPNHVHLLVTPLQGWQLSQLLHSWKSYTAHQLNERLGLQGPFWQDESFNHLVRSGADLEKFASYIRENPAKAGLSAGRFRAGHGTFAVGPASGLSSWGVPPQNENAGGTPAADRPEAGPTPLDALSRTLVHASHTYVVRRDDTKSVIAGYPWFLDWGRDSLICARGLLAAGLHDEVRELLVTFGRFEQDGTLPNSIHGTDASNRDTSDAPLWFGVVCEDLAEAIRSSTGQSSVTSQAAITDSLITHLYATPVGDAANRTLRDVLRSIACGYLAGAPNGIRVDHQSGLVWSPSHFTWMDTNHPAGTPREGYPVEIQALWIRLLRQLARLEAEPWDGRGERWADLAKRAEDSFHRYFWLEDCGWYADVLLAASGTPARTAPPSNALRSNCLLAIALDLDRHPGFAARARRMVAAAAQHLVIPGALRSLAPLPVIPPHPIRGQHGHLLNDPDHPYWGRYEGDEDTRRKPAYHNGTAWTWTFPAFCEALVKAHPSDPRALAAARAYLASVDHLLAEGCLGHLPEVLDGNAPHGQRGCDAQAWGATEALRVWRWLQRPKLG